MTGAWILVIAAFVVAAVAATLAATAISRTTELRESHENLVNTLNKAGAGITTHPTGYASNIRPEPRPLAPEPGELLTEAPTALSEDRLSVPTHTAMGRAAHRLRDSQATAPPPAPVGARDWLVHYSRNPNITWAGVTAEFYDEAGRDPEVKPYFERVDMSRLKSHFANAMVIVTRDGVSDAVLQAMRHAHHGLTDKHGQPMVVTDRVYGKVIDTLVMVLRRNKVPESAIEDLGKTIAPLREAIVHE